MAGQMVDGFILLDLYCGGGGATKGYQNLGYYVIGVDIKPQPRYCGNEFIQGGALEVGRRVLMDYPVYAIHASPPCQRYSKLATVHGNAEKHPALIEPTRELLSASRLPYIIENVEGAPLLNPITLCGSMFGLQVRRHRLFETSFPVNAPRCDHTKQGFVYGVYGHTGAGGNRNRNRNYGMTNNKVDWERAMGIDWMIVDELAQAIPPAYTQYIGNFIPKTYDAERLRPNLTLLDSML